LKDEIRSCPNSKHNSNCRKTLKCKTSKLCTSCARKKYDYTVPYVSVCKECGKEKTFKLEKQKIKWKKNRYVDLV